MQGQSRPYGSAFIGFAVLAVGVSLGMSAITLFARWGLGFPLELLISCVAIVVVATLGPSLWAWQSPERQTWVGPLTAISLVMSCGIIAVAGIIGVVVVCALAVASLGYLFRQIAERTLYIAPRHVAIGCTIAFASALLFATELGGTKYINFLVDQLIQHGRADGDDYLNAALTASIRAHFFPATGIDGLEPARYHFGFYALAAMLAGVAGEDAAVALIGLQMLVLVPMLSFALAQGAAILASRLFVDQQSPTPALTVGAFVLVPLLQLSGVANLVSHSTSMLIGGIMLSLLAPSLLAASHAVEGRANATVHGGYRPWQFRSWQCRKSLLDICGRLLLVISPSVSSGSNERACGCLDWLWLCCSSAVSIFWPPRAAEAASSLERRITSSADSLRAITSCLCNGSGKACQFYVCSSYSEGISRIASADNC